MGKGGGREGSLKGEVEAGRGGEMTGIVRTKVRVYRTVLPLPVQKCSHKIWLQFQVANHGVLVRRRSGKPNATGVVVARAPNVTVSVCTYTHALTHAHTCCVRNYACMSCT